MATKNSKTKFNEIEDTTKLFCWNWNSLHEFWLFWLHFSWGEISKWHFTALYCCQWWNVL